LALEIGLDRSYLGGVERGEHNIALINLLKISGALGVPCGVLLDSAGL
jgi:transcriptional regulator with XRE-family HTH domain